jgi:hypothetical protein
MGCQGRKTQYAIDINGEFFSSGESLRHRCQEILDKYIWPGCPLDVPLSEDDADFFVTLVRIRDPERISDMTYVREVVRTSREGQIGRHLCFVYGSGDRDMIGWSKMCAGARKRPQYVTDALRQAIASQMMQAYCVAFAAGPIFICPKSGRSLSTTGEWADDTAVVHHDAMTFAEIRDQWMAAHGHTFDSLPLVDRIDGGTDLAPGRVRDSWLQYHQDCASLVVVSKRWHDEHHVKERQNVIAKKA